MLSRNEFYSGEGVLVSGVDAAEHGPQSNRALQVEKLAAIFFRRDRARVVLPEGAVPIPCNQVVAPSSQPQGEKAQRSAQSGPSSAQFPKNRDGSVGPR